MSGDAIQGTFSDLRPVKSRGIYQIVIEIPAEAADHALAVLGGLPKATDERWVAIARIHKPADKPAPILEPDDPLGLGPPMPLASRIALLCKEPGFQSFMVGDDDVDEDKEVRTAAAVRHVCGVTSRAQITPGSAAEKRWQRLHDQYTGYMHARL